MRTTSSSPSWRSAVSNQTLRLLRQIGFSFVLVTAVTAMATANPYLPAPGERPISVRIATCAVSGGFAHLYTAIENNLFENMALS